jgi:putative transposase
MRDVPASTIVAGIPAKAIRACDDELSVHDLHDRTRYLLSCEALATTKEDHAFAVFERTFKEFGLPKAIRTDNGVPFASAHALFGLSKLAVWWLRLGIRIERIKPGHPQQNGRHERMHLTLKKEATKPAAHNFLRSSMSSARASTTSDRTRHSA